MKSASEVYNVNEGWGWYDYQPMIEAFGKELIQVRDNDYQGDTRVLIENEGKFGYLIFGWGSCSGCDALQACNSIEDVQRLMDSLANDIKWFDSLDELQTYFKEKDWELEWAWHSEQTKRFIDEVIGFKLPE